MSRFAITDGKGDSKAYMAEVRREGETCLQAEGHPLESAESFEERRKAVKVEVLRPDLKGPRRGAVTMASGS